MATILFIAGLMVLVLLKDAGWSDLSMLCGVALFLLILKCVDLVFDEKSQKGRSL